MERSSTDSADASRKRYVAHIITSGPTVTGDVYITRQAIEGMVEHLKGRALPMNVEHDPTQPPVGRILGGELVELENGEVAVESVVEIFESSVQGRVASVSQLLAAIEELQPLPIAEGPLSLTVDSRSYTPADLETLAATASPAGPVERRTNIQRFSVLPDPLLIIGVGSAFWFTKGFFTRLGENAANEVSAELRESYIAFKAGVRELVARRNPPDRPPITLVTMSIERPGGGVVAVEGSCRATDEMLDDFLDAGDLLFTVARAYLGLVLAPEKVRRMHFRFADGRWVFAYALDDASERVAVFLMSDDEYREILRRATKGPEGSGS